MSLRNIYRQLRFFQQFHEAAKETSPWRSWTLLQLPHTNDLQTITGRWYVSPAEWEAKSFSNGNPKVGDKPSDFFGLAASSPILDW